MTTQIAMFNHKGGVSKTTTAFNLGYMIAKKGKRVLLVDCDPQCNLTGMFLGFKGADEIEQLYSQPGIRDIKDGLAATFEARPMRIEPVLCESLPSEANLLLLPGHIGLAEYETTLGIAQELSGSLPTLQNLPGAMRHLIQITAAANNVDVAIVDMSPSLGPINQNLLATSEFFLVPMAPDYFSVMAIDSLSSILPKWKSWLTRATEMKILKEATYPLVNVNPKYLGMVIQRYRIRSGNTPSKAFQVWIDQIEGKVRETLLPALDSVDMLLPAATYERTGLNAWEPLLQMSDFNGLIAQSQKYSAPVFELSDVQLEQVGIVLETTRASMNKFRQLFDDAAERVLNLIEE